MFTIDNNLAGRDNKFAITPDEMKKLKIYTNKISEFNTKKGLGLQKCELDIYNNYRGRWQR